MTDLLATDDPEASESRAVGSARLTRHVLDNSDLISDPTSVLEFTDADVIDPHNVVEVLDGLKSRSDDVGRASRTALRTLEELSVSHGGSLADPVPTGAEGATLQIEINKIRKHILIEQGLNPDVPDNRIIGAAIGQSDFGPTKMLSNDAALRIKAAHLGVTAAEHTRSRRVDDRPAIGWATIDTTHEVIECLYAASGIAIDAVRTVDESGQ